MADSTKIAWTDHTFNAWMGCHKVSTGCRFCYADDLTSGRMGLDVFGPNTAKRKRTGKATWNNPIKWNAAAAASRTPSRTFCLSLGDFFEDAPGPNEWRPEAWEVIRECWWLDWQILTKRPENVEKMLPDSWTDNPWQCWPNVWLGVSIEDNRVIDRATVLAEVPAFNHFISYEPAIGPGDQIPLDHIEWLIFGGESGVKRRPMKLEWAYDVWQRCIAYDPKVAFFFKQVGHRYSDRGADALGSVVREYPPSWDRKPPSFNVDTGLSVSHASQ